MKPTDLLVVLNPRKIPECMAAIKGLDIDLVYLRNMTEAQIAINWGAYIERYSKYNRWILVGDDCIPRQHALDAVLAIHDAGHPVVTGWSNLSAEDWRSNLTKSPLIGDHPTTGAYDLYTCEEVFGWRDPIVPTSLTGFTLACATREFWAAYPFAVYGGHPGYGSDFHFSKRLEYDNIPIVAAREGFCYHVKERWNQGDRDERKRLYIGIEQAGEHLIRAA